MNYPAELTNEAVEFAKCIEKEIGQCGDIYSVGVTLYTLNKRLYLFSSIIKVHGHTKTENDIAKAINWGNLKKIVKKHD